ncbi:hypothetical protein ACWEQC_40785 [Streptomyces shenzhenensis]
MSADDEHPDIPLPAAATGQALQICFELTTLHPAVSTTIRSADRDDLTTLAMPIKPGRSA